MKSYQGSGASPADAPELVVAGTATVRGSTPPAARAGDGAAVVTGQAQAPVTVPQPAPGETVVVESLPGAVYLLEFAPEDVTFAVDGDNIVMSFDGDGDGAADAHIVFQGLAGMAGAPDAPSLLIAGVDYDISSLLTMAEAPEVARELPEEPGVEPSGIQPRETTRGLDDTGQQPRSEGSSQYEDDFGSTTLSGGSDALSGVGGPLGADFGSGVTSGTVITGLPRPVTQVDQIATRPGVDSDGDGASAGGATGDGDGGGGVETIAGQVVDGYVANATVFRDANENGELDDDEVFTFTNANGDFTLTGGSGPLVAIGGTDVSTGLAFDGVLKAPAGSTVITPLTTLVQQIVESDPEKKTTAAEAESKVKKALGIKESFQVSKTDPVKAAAEGNEDALQVVKAGISVANTAKQVKSALKGAGATDEAAASNAAFKALANKVSQNEGSGNATNLSDSEQVEDVLNDAAQITNTNVGETDIQNARNVIVATNTVVNGINTEGGGSATEKLQELAKVAKVAQGDASTAIENKTVDENYDAGNVQAAADAVTDIGPVAGSSALTEGADSKEGTEAADSFDGLGGDDTIRGLGGNDVISGGAGNDLIYGGTGNDVLSGGTGNDTLYGDEGNDNITGDAGNDLIYGGAGNDILAGGAGNDTIYGGAGDDVVRFDGRVGEYSFDFAAGGTITVTKLATGEVDTLHEVESLRFANGKSMTITSGEVDISKLGSVNVAFGDLSGLTKITTATGQKLQLDAEQIEAILDEDPNGTLIIAGGAAVNVVNADLNLPNDGGQPTVKNLLALEFEGRDADNSLIPDNLTVGGNHEDAFAAFWIPLDLKYVGHNDYYNLAVNTSFAYLGNDYAAYLNAGGEALLDLVKVIDSRLQTLHDNLLGNLNDGPIKKRFIDENEDDPRTNDGLAFGDRPVHNGSVDTDGLYSDESFAARTIGWDLAHGINLPDELPAPYGVLNDANVLSGTADGDPQTDGVDFFYGGGGNDTIDGGGGDDTAVYSGNRLDYTVSGDEDGKVTVTDTDTVGGGDEGSDTLTSIETLQFADGTLSFGAKLVQATPEVDPDDASDGFHPGEGNSDVNFAIHDNTEVEVEAAIKAKARYAGDLESDGLTYYAETGTSVRPGELDGGFWNFDYSVIDYSGDASIDRYDIAISADFIDIHGVRASIMDFDAVQHEVDHPGEKYYDGSANGTEGIQNSQNLLWKADTGGYNPSAPGTYILVLSVTDKDTGEVVAQTEMRVEVAPNVTVGADGDYATIQAAIDAASDGDTIFVDQGTYAESLTINKEVKLYGVDGAIIQGGIVIQAAGAGSTINGFTIENQATAPADGESRIGIHLEKGATDVIIENNVFEATADYDAIYTRGMTMGGGNDGLVIQGNSFAGWRSAVYLEDNATEVQVKENTFENNLAGVVVDNTKAAITNNSFLGSDGIGLGAPNPASDGVVTLNGNTFENGSVNVFVDNWIVKADDTGEGTVLVLQPGIQNITLQGSADLAVIGTSGMNKTIVGNDGDNRLEGGAGNDTLIGGAGDDTLVGGDGADVFVYSDIVDAGDVIDGFVAGEDSIDLDKLLETLGVDAADREGRIDVDQAGPNADATISVDTDTDSDGFEVTLITVTNVTGTLTIEDNQSFVG